eukprot:362210_1
MLQLLLLLCSCWFCSFSLYSIIIWFITFIKQNRIHWIECHEETWCPILFREIIINSIQVFWCSFGLTDIFGSPAATVAFIIYNLKQKHTNNNLNKYKLTILDLCSGSGGPVTIITDELNKRINTTTIVTDLFPHLMKWKLLSAKNKNIKYCKIPVNATNIQFNKIENNLNVAQIGNSNSNNKNIYLRSIFGAFHHFSPDLLVSILYDVMRCNHDFIAVELVSRCSLFGFLIVTLETAITIPFLMIMQIKYFFVDQYYELSLLQKILNSLIIIISIPIWGSMFLNDSIISHARCYRENEILKLTQMANIKAKKNDINTEYEWKCWAQKSNMMFPFDFLLPMIVLYGHPKDNRNQKDL